MDKNVDQGSVVVYTAAPLNKISGRRRKIIVCFICVGASISIGREIWCLPYAGFFFYKVVELVGGGSVINEAYPV